MNAITDKLIFLIYPILFVSLFFEAKISKKNEWNEEAFSLSQMKAIQGFAAVCIMLHHIAQKTCAPWINKMYIRHGLDVFVPIGYWLVGIFLFCSGYGLYVSYKKKENYFKGYFKRRVLPLILAFYSTGWLFLLVRFLMKQRMQRQDVIWFATGLKLSNPNAWFVIAMPYLYLVFYLSFRFCKNQKISIIILCAMTLAYMILGTCINHNDFLDEGRMVVQQHSFLPDRSNICRERRKDNRAYKKVLYIILSPDAAFDITALRIKRMDSGCFFLLWRNVACGSCCTKKMGLSHIADAGFLFFCFLCVHCRYENKNRKQISGIYGRPDFGILPYTRFVHRVVRL